MSHAPTALLRSSTSSRPPSRTHHDPPRGECQAEDYFVSGPDIVRLVPQLYHPDHACREVHQVRKLALVATERPSSSRLIRPTSLDVQFVDFDGVRFHLSTPERKTCLLLSMSIRCWDELVRYGVDGVLRREYGDRVKAQPEPEYNVSLELDLEQFPPPGGARSFNSPCAHMADTIQRSARP